MANYDKIRTYHNSYSNLAAAILRSGEKEYDTFFMDSDWAEVLREMCRLDDLMYANRGTRATRGVVEHIGN